MLAKIQHNSKTYTIDLSKPLDISIAIKNGADNVNAWGIEPPQIIPHQFYHTIMRVSNGASVNFNTITFNPHAHGTHTETVGHITKKQYPVNAQLNKYFFLAEVITVAPEKLNSDYVISKQQIQFALKNKPIDAVVIRTLPNTIEKLSKNYTNANATYLLEDAAAYLKELNISHLLIDLPSVDKENDNGQLLAHKAFWFAQGKIRSEATITEFIYVANYIKDGTYFLNLQIAPFINDATPSKPVLYKVIETK